MKTSPMLRAGVLMFGLALSGSVVRAQNYQQYNFTGVGTNGVTAYGIVVLDSNPLVDTYYSNGAIYSQGISITLENIPGPGPNAVTFSRTDPLSNSIESTFLYVAGTSIYLGPRGEYDYIDSNRYILSGQNQPTGTYYQTDLYYNLTLVSTITWSAAIAAVPEPSTYALLLGVVGLGLALGRSRRPRAIS